MIFWFEVKNSLRNDKKYDRQRDDGKQTAYCGKTVQQFHGRTQEPNENGDPTAQRQQIQSSRDTWHA